MSLAPHARVAVLLVSHDGERWLPGVLAGLAEQDLSAPPVPEDAAAPDGAPSAPGRRDPLGEIVRVVAVDTGSRDASRDLLQAAEVGPVDVVVAEATTTYPEAVAQGVARCLSTLEEPPTWIWLLHDDARPAPDALARLLAAAADHPEADLLGPKLREWPSLRRLLEVGVTMSGTGRRETGLEPGEFDQGQHDAVRRVLAVSTAGLLVRPEVLTELGLDPRLPLFGSDLDLGWRAASAGLTTLVVPEAVVFHAEAAHRGLRRTALTGTHARFGERRAALYTLLANATPRRVPWLVLRLVLGTALRALGLVLLRAPGEALDEVAALVAVVLRPAQVRAGRRERAAAGLDPARARPLLAPAWMPYRHGLDAVGAVVTAVTQQATDVAERRRIAAAEADPSSLAAARLRAERAAARAAETDDEAALVAADTGLAARLLTSPVALGLAAVVLVLLVAGRTALGGVVGGALSPAPASVGDWWHLHTSAWHPLGWGTDVPAPPSVLPLALLGSVLGPGATVSALLWLSGVVALGGAWRFLRVAGRLASPGGVPRGLLLAAAAAYALAPATSGAWGEGRLGLVVGAAVLPWLAHAALGFAEPDAERRRRAMWRVGLLLALVTSFAPLAWWLALVVIGAVTLLAARALADGAHGADGADGAGRRRSPRTLRQLSAPWWGALGIAAGLLLPWWLPLLLTGHPAGLLLEGGRPPGPTVEGLDVVLGRLGADAAPRVLAVVLLLAAVAALLPRATRVPVLACWSVAGLAVVVALVVGRLEVTLGALRTGGGLGIAVLTITGALLTAAVLGVAAVTRPAPILPPDPSLSAEPAGGAPSRPASARLLGAALGVLVAVVPLGGAAWFLTDDPLLDDDPVTVVPAYMLQSAARGDQYGVLVVRGDLDTGLDIAVRRGTGPTLGQDEIVALAGTPARAVDAVTTLLSRPSPQAVDAVAALGVEFLVLPAPADGRVAATLDASAGLAQASAPEGGRAWQVTRPVPDAVADPGGAAGPLRTGLVVLQLLGLVVVLVLAAPSVRAARRVPEEEPTS
ncbi:glycosyltransferase [Nocardioides sp.]|uniref:glycosyltransferase n=1 Tax=Nocardioides sp. TaxID=35761 RepID=UPI003516BC08